MGKTKFILTAILILAIWTVSALAQNWIVFPAQGQSQEQMERDKYARSGGMPGLYTHTCRSATEIQHIEFYGIFEGQEQLDDI